MSKMSSLKPDIPDTFWTFRTFRTHDHEHSKVHMPKWDPLHHFNLKECYKPHAKGSSMVMCCWYIYTVDKAPDTPMSVPLTNRTVGHVVLTKQKTPVDRWTWTCWRVGHVHRHVHDLCTSTNRIVYTVKTEGCPGQNYGRRRRPKSFLGQNYGRRRRPKSFLTPLFTSPLIRKRIRQSEGG